MYCSNPLYLYYKRRPGCRNRGWFTHRRDTDFGYSDLDLFETDPAEKPLSLFDDDTFPYPLAT